MIFTDCCWWKIKIEEGQIDDQERVIRNLRVMVDHMLEYAEILLKTPLPKETHEAVYCNTADILQLFAPQIAHNPIFESVSYYFKILRSRDFLLASHVRVR